MRFESKCVRTMKVAVSLGIMLFLISSCASVPVKSLASGEMRLVRMDVSPKDDIREALPFNVTIGFESEGQPEIITACFFWSGAGPYCSKITDVTYGPPGMIKLQLRPRSAGMVSLEAYVAYKKDGNTESTNVVSERLRVIRSTP